MEPRYILLADTLLFGIVFLVCLRNKNVGVLAKLATLAYAVIPLCSFFFSLQGAYDIKGLKLWPFLVYLVVFVMLIIPLFKTGSLAKRLTIKNIRLANVISNIYLVCCVFQIFISFDKTLSAISSGDYLAIYLSRTNEDVVYYNNLFEQIIINVVNYFFIPIVVYAFYIFAHLLFLPFLATSMFAISFASRTEFFNILLVYGSVFLLFKQFLSKDKTKKFFIVGLTFLGVAIIGSIAITSSRFSSDDEGNWLADYFGESNITAHDRFAYTTRFSEGTYFFRNVVKMTGRRPISTQCAKDHGYGFQPIISTRYSDFGFSGLVVYVIVCITFVSFVLRKKRLSWGAFTIVLYYYKCLTLGVLYENNNEISWLYVLIVAFVLNALTDSKKLYDENYSVLSSSVSSHVS